MEQFGGGGLDTAAWTAFAPILSYFQGNLDVPEDYQKLQTFLRDKEGGPAPPGITSRTIKL